MFMEWLTKLLLKLLGLEAPPGATSLQAAEVHARGIIGWYVAAGLLALFAIGIIYLYLKETAPLSRLRRTLLAGLRVLVIAFLLALLLRPVVVLEYKGERPQGVAVLLDNSESMKLQDRRVSAADKLRVAIAKGLLPANTSPADAGNLAKIPAETPLIASRADIVQAVLANSQLKLLDGLQGHGPLRSYLFGQQLRRVSHVGEPSQALSKAFAANESRTALSDCINEILVSKDGDLPGALVVITDGQDNASKIPLDEVLRILETSSADVIIRPEPNSQGLTLYSTRSHYQKTTGFFKRYIDAVESS